MKKHSTALSCFLISFAVLACLEIILRASTFGISQGGFGKGFIIALLMAAFFACLVTTAAVFFSKRIAKNLLTILALFISVLYSAQIVYYDIFRTFFTTYSMLNGGQILEFIKIIIDTIIDKIVPVALNFAVCGLAIYAVRRKVACERPWENNGNDGNDGSEEKHASVKKTLLTAASFMCTCLIISGLLVNCGDTGMGTPYEYYRVTNEIKGCFKSFGLPSSAFIDLKRMLIGFNEVPEKIAITEMDEYFGIGEDEDEGQGEDENGSRINNMTGAFQGKNLIYITAESFTDLAIDEKLTPTLYRLSSEGLSFENYYNPVWGVSTLDGEYVNCLGLIPKAGVWSMTESSDNYLPYTLGNQMRTLGYVTKAYHNHDISFYQRQKSHPNLGYDFDGQGGSFDFGDCWPESDLEMINQTTPEYLTPDENGEIKPFHVYYLTVSGHMEYNFRYQEMSMKHEEEVASLELSEGPRAYVAANMELDLAMELLLERLDEAGVLENTVIVIAGDHYPYSLSNDELSELRGHQISEPYEKFKSTAIIWTPDMEPQTIEKTVSNLDLLPTVSNLFGLEYDSRLLMGNDIFSDEPGLVVFEDKDWITDRGTRRELAASGTASDIEYVNEIDSRVADMFKYSAWILDYDYYSRLNLS